MPSIEGDSRASFRPSDCWRCRKSRVKHENTVSEVMSHLKRVNGVSKLLPMADSTKDRRPRFHVCRRWIGVE